MESRSPSSSKQTSRLVYSQSYRRHIVDFRKSEEWITIPSILFLKCFLGLFNRALCFIIGLAAVRTDVTSKTSCLLRTAGIRCRKSEITWIGIPYRAKSDRSLLVTIEVVSVLSRPIHGHQVAVHIVLKYSQRHNFPRKISHWSRLSDFVRRWSHCLDVSVRYQLFNSTCLFG